LFAAILARIPRLALAPPAVGWMRVSERRRGRQRLVPGDALCPSDAEAHQKTLETMIPVCGTPEFRVAGKKMRKHLSAVDTGGVQLARIGDIPILVRFQAQPKWEMLVTAYWKNIFACVTLAGTW
jgi:hypothetical protein